MIPTRQYNVLRKGGPHDADSVSGGKSEGGYPYPSLRPPFPEAHPPQNSHTTDAFATRSNAPDFIDPRYLYYPFRCPFSSSTTTQQQHGDGLDHQHFRYREYPFYPTYANTPYLHPHSSYPTSHSRNINFFPPAATKNTAEQATERRAFNEDLTASGSYYFPRAREQLFSSSDPYSSSMRAASAGSPPYVVGTAGSAVGMNDPAPIAWSSFSDQQRGSTERTLGRSPQPITTADENRLKLDHPTIGCRTDP